jgi:mannose-6-phosphate isomerase-like protein (cupin superfamily)
MTEANISAEAYSGEPVRFPPLRVVNLGAEAAAVEERFRNMVMQRVNASCLRLSVLDETFGWHHHPTSDELFLVVEGRLAIDLADGTELQLGPLEAVTLPAGTVHRTRALGRTVTLTFEELAAPTVFVGDPGRESGRDPGREPRRDSSPAPTPGSANAKSS